MMMESFSDLVINYSLFFGLSSFFLQIIKIYFQPLIFLDKHPKQYIMPSIMKINIEKIEKERKRQGLTAMELARRIGITRAAYSFFLRVGSTKLGTLVKIAKVLDFDPKDLLSRKGG